MLPPDEGSDFEILRTGLFSYLAYSLGASTGPRDGDLDGCTSYDGDSDDDATFSFHTFLVCGLDFCGVDSFFTTSTSSSFC